MDDPMIPRPDDDDPNIADASSLFRDDAPAPRPRPKNPTKAPANTGGDYELHDAPAESPRPRAVIPTDLPRTEKLRKPPEESLAAKPLRPEPTATVDEVWSRGAEWGGTIALLVLTAIGVLILLYVLMSMGLYTLFFLAMIGAIPLFVVVGYPILITLERPVRMTPEQALRDYYTALSHHAPHFKRMWLLLSNAGRVSGSYASYEGFQSYWKTRLSEIRGAHAGSFTPLKFQINEFVSPKSGGLDAIEAKFTVSVFVRGQSGSGPIASIPMTMSLVKGPDRMWYLNRGTLP